MKKSSITFLCLAAVLCLSLVFTQSSVKASQAAPGSAADPVVTQSYVDGKINELQDMISSINNRTQPYITDNQQQTPPQPGLTDYDKSLLTAEILRQVELMLGIGQGRDSGDDLTPVYTPVFAYAGQTIIGGEGTEIILRSGAATGYMAGQNGISDVTAGVEIYGGYPIYTNHLLIIPREDGRGVKLSENSWFLIKGSYTIGY